MKKVLLGLMLFVASLCGGELPEFYQVIVNHTGIINMSGDVNVTKIFFGDKKDLMDTFRKANMSQVSSSGYNSAAKAGQGSSAGNVKANVGAGLVIGLLVGAATPWMWSFHEDKEYILIYKVVNSVGEEKRVAAMFVSSSFSDEDVIEKELVVALKERGEIK